MIEIFIIILSLLHILTNKALSHLDLAQSILKCLNEKASWKLTSQFTGVCRCLPNGTVGWSTPRKIQRIQHQPPASRPGLVRNPSHLENVPEWLSFFCPSEWPRGFTEIKHYFFSYTLVASLRLTGALHFKDVSGGPEKSGNWLQSPQL